ncbi:Teichoic-acid-transporting ATPase [Stanieria cyanosphaera PCC 7437]|uniref:Teichoic-acid-transporting ATPase n=1 Tax=Stanieria cyanosphaera (strain ATCC 29371 / PCC 7437) TaxID=111780 RepID=K9XRG6_STAC7|nr:ABC transporter ATP-binding protein [Stanieria cyanosphaera]AFZ34646.1 Teichoic-acid-transporting ATPase [Stanieria cyanosphaera PCC 7437]
MSDTIIRVENLGKKYIIGHQQEGRSQYVALRDVIAEGAKSVVKRFTKPQESNSNREEFWALKDVSFEIKRGECVGIIGRNGAGKSTLLKILSRITEPTTGRISIKGRVASLLEVGTGFHPELTGRENIYLNGAILGMSRAEIKKKFDEIVAFAEVEKFLDTPVKHYSSGMYVRLAFAVAAHLEPEILVVDEVLAVGDAAFQKKCLGKMGDVATKEGRTVLFVSHNMATVQNLCSQCLYLNSGKIKEVNSTEFVINQYLVDISSESNKDSLAFRKDRQCSNKVKIVNFYILDDCREKQSVLQSGNNYTFVMEYENYCVEKIFDDVIGSIAITDNRNEITFLIRSNFTDQNFSINQQKGYIEAQVKDFNLTTGIYNTILFLSHRETEILDCISNACIIQVEAGDFFNTGSIGLPSHCKTLTRADWITK